jgi:hypothetical protein
VLGGNVEKTITLASLIIFIQLNKLVIPNV